MEGFPDLMQKVYEARMPDSKAGMKHRLGYVLREPNATQGENILVQCKVRVQCVLDDPQLVGTGSDRRLAGRREAAQGRPWQGVQGAFDATVRLFTPQLRLDVLSETND